MYRDTPRVRKMLRFFKGEEKKIAYLYKEIEGRDAVIKIVQEKVERATNIIESLETV